MDVNRMMSDEGTLSGPEDLGLEDGIQVEMETTRRTGRESSSTDLVRLYLQEIGKVPLLKRDEEVELARQVQHYMSMIHAKAQEEKQQGRTLTLEEWAELTDRPWSIVGREITVGTRAKKKMTEANLRLVVSVAKKYQNRGLELLDLVQEGTLGLERAVEKFDPTKGYRFSTYAYWWIRQGITRAIATQSRTIRLPVHVTEKLNRIKKAQRRLSQTLGRTATLAEIAQNVEMDMVEVRDLLSRVPRAVSLDTKVGKDKDTELGELLESEAQTPEQAVTREALERDMEGLLQTLNSRERDVLRMRYGLVDGRTYSLSEIGQILDLSRERVRQIETKAFQKLRQPKRRLRIKDYLEALE
ncbi:RNA polymerase sigma factor, RpoD/SigA family [Candidatus Cyanaurora vandensis]|uniref:RNA polymerase sigma factor, RpoD/SigA family n=1 Tax=Candidatus Cyanaurora vandensis TaxID=2714958 RepID=UPI00257EDEE8|nr:RNA polymerase sigma factor, RpoD/SigA family [Candidatus Cyanaurora vandensis]